MKYSTFLYPLILLTALLSLAAAGAGLFFDTQGDPYLYTNHRGETVTVFGHGLYEYDTLSSAAQMKGNDLVTLVLGIPLLLVSAWLAFKGSLRGKLVLTGTAGFFLYTYMSMASLTSYNTLFLVYIAIFICSLWTFILCLLSFDPETLPSEFSEKLPRMWIASIMFIIGGFLSLAWLGRIVPPLLSGSVPVLENTTTLVIQFMDLGLIVPVAFVGGILLLKRKAWGYLLASVLLTKGITLGTAVSVMAINMSRLGVPESTVIMVPFLAITILNLVSAVLLLRNVRK